MHQPNRKGKTSPCHREQISGSSSQGLGGRGKDTFDGAFWGDEGVLYLDYVGGDMGAYICHISSHCSLRMVPFTVYKVYEHSS